jgi:hypothetical protein
MIVALLASSAFAAAEPLPTDGLSWRWAPSEDRRYYVESAVGLPQQMWFLADQNRDARVIGWHLRLVLDCNDVDLAGRHAWNVGCTLRDVGIEGIAMPGDAGDGLLPPILDELDAKLTGAMVRMILDTDGRVRKVWIDGLERHDRRQGIMNENARQMLVRALAGFDLQLPDGGASEEGLWTQRNGWLMAIPAPAGSFGGGTSLHVVAERSGSTAGIHSVAKGVVGPMQRLGDEPTDLYAMQITSEAAFDVDRGLLLSRSWEAEGDATAGSAVSEGTHGLPYLQRGYLGWLPPDAPIPEVGPTREIAAGGEVPTVLTAAPEPVGG